MKTIRLRDMTDEEYRQVTKSRCPVCGSIGHARTNYSNITSNSRYVDVICDNCGAAWSIYAPEDGSNGFSQEQMQIPEIATHLSAKDMAVYELKHMSDNKIRRSSKSDLISLAVDLGEDSLIRMNKREIAEALISIRDGEA